jgi:regulator of protease activity HflC (stomatin/prohibitin superfamily)
MEILTAGLFVAVVYLFASLRIIRQYERAVTFFLGRFSGTKGPGLIFVPALFAHAKRISLRIVALDIPPQDVITRDNVTLKVNAVLYMRVRDPSKAVIEIEDYLYATSQLAQTTLRSVLGEVELDELLADREKINAILKRIIDERTEPWGIEASAVEVKDVDLPESMKRAMARQAEAERERRAKVIAAQGELQASATLAQAARTLGAEPNALQLRYLQTVAEIAAENNSTTLFPIPIEMFRPFIRMAEQGGSPAAGPAPVPLPRVEFPDPALPPETQQALAPPADAAGMPVQQLSDLMSRLRLESARASQGTDG